ncbi:MAG: hypothetical protein IH586_08330, partial [Anaerolineaceae bacterium]|nr:hypothetical protein [Anaerolineaceae bacterium]
MLSSVDKIQKFFKLEIERGFDNRAVVGGLDKILPAWENEARENRLHDEIIQVVLEGLRSYPGLEPSQRAEKLDLLMERLEQAQESSTSTGQPAAENTPSPTANQSNHSPSRNQPFEPDEPHPRPQTRQQRQQARMDQPRTDP